MEEYFRQFKGRYFELGVPARLKRDARTHQDFVEFKNNFQRVNLYSTVYGVEEPFNYRTAVIDKFFFEFDDNDGITEELLKDVRKCIGWIENETDFDPQIFFSGNRGFHFIIHFEPVDLKHRNAVLQRFRDNIISLTGCRKIDDACHNSTAQMRRIPNTKHMKTGLFAIPILMEELKEWSAEEIYDEAKKPRRLWHDAKLSIDLPRALKEIDMKVEEEIVLDRLLPPIKLEMKEDCMAFREAMAGVDYGYRDFALVGLVNALKNQGWDRESVKQHLIDAWLPKNEPRPGDIKWINYKVNYHWQRRNSNPCGWFHKAKMPLCEDCPARLKMERVK